MGQEANQIYEKLKNKLGKIVPDVELVIKSQIAVEIRELKKQRNAVVLGHNYMEPVLFYSVPDFKGDSLDLSRKAAQTDKDVIVFCGVRFMAETAKILNPTKTVLLPAEKAGCSLAAGTSTGRRTWRASAGSTSSSPRSIRAGWPRAPPTCSTCK